LALGRLLLKRVDLEAARPVVSKRTWDVAPLIDLALLHRSIVLDAVVSLGIVGRAHQENHQEKVGAHCKQDHYCVFQIVL
jgi:hypothetical protein